MDLDYPGGAMMSLDEPSDEEFASFRWDDLHGDSTSFLGRLKEDVVSHKARRRSSSEVNGGYDGSSTLAPDEGEIPEEAGPMPAIDISLSNVEPSTLDDINNRFIASFDLRLTDYFMNARCMCSYTLYSFHFNDFGVNKVATRRYSEIWSYDNVLSDMGYKTPAPIPPKGYWNKMDPMFLSQRFQSLRHYFAMQLQHPSNAQLLVLQMFLGVGDDSMLYLQLVLARTKEERAKAVNTLLVYLLKKKEDRGELLSSILKPPLTNFTMLSPAKAETSMDTNSDYRLGTLLTFESLLDCLISCDHKTLSEICTIFLYMLHHEEGIRKRVMNAKAISHVTKAICRLLASHDMCDITYPFYELPHPLTPRMIDGIDKDTKSAWDVVSYFLVLALNVMPEVASDNLSTKGYIENLNTIVDRNDYNVMKRFAIWLLWLGPSRSFNTQGDRGSVTSLLKKLYSTEDTTIKTLCGLVIVALIGSGWFDKEAEPRALASVLNLLDSIHDIDTFIGQQMFTNFSLSRFQQLLSNISLPVGARLFLVSVLNNHVLIDFKKCLCEVELNKLSESDDVGDVTHLSLQLFGNSDPDYRSDLSIASDITFHESFASMYCDKLRPISESLSEILYNICDISSSSGNDHSGRDEDSMFDDLLLSCTAAECLLLLPYTPPTSGEGDYFDVDFDLQSCVAHLRNLVHLKGDSVTLEMGTIEEINLEHTVVLRLDRKFFERRLSVMQIIFSKMNEKVSELSSIHLSNNGMTKECMELLRKYWPSRGLYENIDNVSKPVEYLEGNKKEQGDIFANFEFPGMESPVLDVSSGFNGVDTFEMNRYTNVLRRYNTMQKRLMKLVKFYILFHQACESRLTVFKPMVASLGDRISDIGLDLFVDIDELEAKLIKAVDDRNAGLKEEVDIATKIQGNNSMLSRLRNMSSSNKVKLEACRKQVTAMQRRIDDIPRLRKESSANENKLRELCEELQESIKAANDNILVLQSKIANDESLKQDYSSQISQVTHLSSVVDKGDTSSITEAIESISCEELKKEILAISSSVLSEEHMSNKTLDPEATFKLKKALLNHLHLMQDKLNTLYSGDNNKQIAMLNNKVRQDEERLYRVQVDLQNVRRSLVVDSSVLEDSLATHKLMASNLENTSSNLDAEVDKITAANRELDKQLYMLKPNNDTKLKKLEETRHKFMEMITEQRKTRLESLKQLVAAEFMCKKVLQEQMKLVSVFSQKSKLVDAINKGLQEEKASRSDLIKAFTLASQRLQQTAEFLNDSGT